MIRFTPILLTALAFAQQPSGDSRNLRTPNTDTVFRMPEYRTLADWEKRKAHLRKQILTAAGLNPMPVKPPMKTLIFGRIENKDYSIEKVAIETLPGYWLGANLYRPVGKPGRHPGIASPHGHWNYGRLEHQPLASVPARAISLARLGFVVLAYDMVGYDDTMQTPHIFGSEQRDQLWSFGPLQLQLWNSIRVLDFLQTLPDVDPENLGATGASGGGTQVFLLSAVDDRVRFSAPVNMISSIMQGGSPCENAPGLRINANNMEFGAMMAPRPMLMVAATGDWTKNTPQVEYPAVRGIYDLYDARALVESVQIDAPHNYNQQSREAVYRFFAKTALKDPEASTIKERSIRLEKLQDMLVWHGRSLPAGALDFDGVRQLWIKVGKAQTASIQSNEAAKERLQLTLATEWPTEVLESREGERMYLTRRGVDDRIPAVVMGKGTPSRLVVSAQGIEAAGKLPEVRRWVEQGDSVLLIDAFQTGSARATRDQSHRHFLTFNKTDDSERVQDIVTALAWLRQKGAKDLRLAAFDRAGIWGVFAAAVAPVRVTMDVRPSLPADASDEALLQSFFAPGVQRAGGLELARKLAGL